VRVPAAVAREKLKQDGGSFLTLSSASQQGLGDLASPSETHATR
jgi:hypothetical protein